MKQNINLLISKSIKFKALSVDLKHYNDPKTFIKYSNDRKNVEY